MSNRFPPVLVLFAVIAAACGPGAAPTDLELSAGLPGAGHLAVVAQTCTALTIRGTPIAGTLCGGSSTAPNCSPGAVYQCNSNTAINNCTLQSSCASGCLSDPRGGATCFAGVAPLALSASALPGGSNVTATVTLADGHPGGAIVNLKIDRSDLVAARAGCNLQDLAAGATSATFAMPTAVVPAATPVTLHGDLAYLDAANVSRELVSHAITLTLNPGGVAPPPPPLLSFTLTPSTVAAGGQSFMDVVLQRMAPISGVQIAATSSNPAVASIIAGGQPFVFGGCTYGGGAATVQAASSVSQQTAVTISASSHAAGQAALTAPLTVTTGCAPKSCLDLVAPACSGPDGCGGTLMCGCNFGQTCGGGGSPGVCGTSASLSVSSLSLGPAAVAGGGSSTGTIALSMPAPAGGAGVFLSSSSGSASVPQSVVVPAGQTSASFPIGTSAVGASTSAIISASLGGTQTATLTITAVGATPPGAPSLTLTATGRTGVTVLSSPAGLSVPVGQTGSASFASGTQVTLSLSNRTAVWSGACATTTDTSSCTFTDTGGASVTADVQ